MLFYYMLLPFVFVYFSQKSYAPNSVYFWRLYHGEDLKKSSDYCEILDSIVLEASNKSQSQRNIQRKASYQNKDI